MRRLEYAIIVKEKLKELKAALIEEYGNQVATKSVRKILHNLKELEQYSQMGVALANMYDVDTDYRYLYIAPNYFFYRIEPERILVLEMFHEREDFMEKLFGEPNLLQEETFQYRP